MRFTITLLLLVATLIDGQAQCANPLNLQDQWEIPFPLNSQCLTIQHDSTRPYIYVAGKERGLLVYDVSNLSNPIKVDSVPVSMMNNMEVVNVEQSGNYVYLSLGNTYQNNAKPGVAIVDVTDPANVIFKDYWFYDAVAGGGGIVKVVGDYAYFGGMRRGLFILNVADKSNITMTSHLELAMNWPNPNAPDSLKYNARGLEVRGNYAYVCYDAGGLRVIDATDKANPVETGHYSNPAVYNKARAYNNIVLDDTIAFVGADYCGMEILSIANHGNITQVGWWNPWGCETPSNTWTNSEGYANELRYNKPCGLMFIAGGTTDLSVVNVADPANPQLCATYGQPTDTLVTWGLALYQNQVYLGYIYNPWCFPFCAYWPGLKMLTWDNACELGVNDVVTADMLSIYPNPAKEEVMISGLSKGQTLQLYDLTGRLMAVDISYGQNKAHIATANFAPGAYVIRCGEKAASLLIK